jgi:serine/threonine protein kinase
VALKKLIFRYGSLSASKVHFSLCACNSDEDEAKEFKKEVLIMCKVQHPNILAFVGVCAEGNEMCILTEVTKSRPFLLRSLSFCFLHSRRSLTAQFCARGNMASILKSTPDLPWAAKLKMACHAARGMVCLFTSLCLLCSAGLVLHCFAALVAPAKPGGRCICMA